MKVQEKTILFSYATLRWTAEKIKRDHFWRIEEL